MFEGLQVAVVVPAFREQAHIASVITTMPALVDHIIVVDDASPDDTSAAALAVQDPRTEVIRHEHNKGVGGAIVTGHRRALELGADVSVVMAGDGQMDPEHLPRLLKPLVEDGYAFAKANRFYSATSFAGMPTYRIIGNVLLTFMTKAASGYWNLVDPQNGYTAISRETLERLPLDRLAERYEFENDQLIWLNILDARVIDVPIPARSTAPRCPTSGCMPCCRGSSAFSSSASGAGYGANTCSGPFPPWRYCCSPEACCWRSGQ